MVRSSCQKKGIVENTHCFGLIFFFSISASFWTANKLANILANLLAIHRFSWVNWFWPNPESGLSKKCIFALPITLLGSMHDCGFTLPHYTRLHYTLNYLKHAGVWTHPSTLHCTALYITLLGSVQECALTLPHYTTLHYKLHYWGARMSVDSPCLNLY